MERMFHHWIDKFWPNFGENCLKLENIDASIIIFWLGCSAKQRWWWWNKFLSNWVCFHLSTKLKRACWNSRRKLTNKTGAWSGFNLSDSLHVIHSLQGLGSIVKQEGSKHGISQLNLPETAWFPTIPTPNLGFNHKQNQARPARERKAWSYQPSMDWQTSRHISSLTSQDCLLRHLKINIFSWVLHSKHEELILIWRVPPSPHCCSSMWVSLWN